MTVYIYEDRPSGEPGVRLLVASLSKHSPSLPVVLYFIPADDAFQQWITQFPNVELRRCGLAGNIGWNVKPLVLRQALADGCRDVIWLDSDILVTGPVEPLFHSLDHETIVFAEEALWAYYDGPSRARGWGFAVGREMPIPLNSGVLRITNHHLGLIERWADLLKDDKYLAAQNTAWRQRPAHLLGDQDALCALLCSTEFSDLPWRILRRGTDILQIFGLKSYTIPERLCSLRYGLPVFIHTLNFKPWLLRSVQIRDLFEYLQWIYLDTSPYSLVAREYRDQLGGDTDWLQPNTWLGRLLRLGGFGNVPLTGLPLAILFDLFYGSVGCVKRLLGRGWRPAARSIRQHA